MPSVLDMTIKYTEVGTPELDEVYSSTTTVNRAGDQLEFFIKDLIAGSLEVKSKEDKVSRHNRVFSWLGSRNNPPDMMIESAEAIEVKKCRYSSNVQLNSSTPHHKLRSDDSRITEDAKRCEDWTEKDMVYVIGNTEGSQVKKLWVTYGDCWGDSASRYDNLAKLISSKISEGVEELEHGNLDTEDTNEIGKVFDVDPAKRTKLRIRGMWTITHPEKCFSDYIKDYEKKVQNRNPLFFIVRKSRYESFPESQKKIVSQNPNIISNEVKIPDPSDENRVINTIILESYTETYDR